MLLTVVVLVLLTAAYFFLPYYLESRLLPRLIAEIGLTDADLKVRNIGIFSADLGPLRIGPARRPALLIRSVQIDYAPQELVRKKIKRIGFSGIELYAQVENGTLSLREFDPAPVAAALQSRKKATQPSDGSLPPISVERLEVSSALLILDRGVRRYRLPFEVEVMPEDAGYKRFAATAALFPEGHKISAAAQIDLDENTMRLTAAMDAIKLEEFAGRIQGIPGLKLAGTATVQTTAKVQLAPFKIASATASLQLQKSGIRFNDVEMTSEDPHVDISGHGSLTQLTARYAVVLPDVRIRSGSETIHLPRVEVKGNANLAGGDSNALTADFELRTPDTGATLNAATLNIKEIRLSGSVRRAGDSGLKLDGNLRFEDAGFLVPQLDVEIANARGEIPLKWPPVPEPQSGRISIGLLRHRQVDLGNAAGDIRQTATGFSFEGRHTNKLLPQLSLTFKGTAGLYKTDRRETKIHLELLRPDGASAIDLARFAPSAKDMMLSGKFLINADLMVAGGGFKGSIQSEFSNGVFSIRKNKLSVEGIHMSLALPELPNLRSAPGQQIRFDRISFGGLVATEGIIDFQLESPTSFLIEKTHFVWCGGNVDTQSMRVSPGLEDYRIVFYCDRLNLANVLEQFGAAAAEGQGTVNGRIPVHYADGKLSFADGFLFSTPGGGGQIHLSGTDILTAGIPPESPQYIQMELAREALKDYDYAWAKLRITSEGEDLLLQMQMDGKPAGTLPFVYSKEIGGFIKVEAESQGSRFQGIRLDVNFRLPLNKILLYKDLFKMIQ